MIFLLNFILHEIDKQFTKCTDSGNEPEKKERQALLERKERRFSIVLFILLIVYCNIKFLV